MLTAAFFTFGLILGVAGTWFVQRGELAYLRAELRTAQDRLVSAWRDDRAIIPPRPAEKVAVQKLPAALQESIDEWDDPETRAAIESRIRDLYYDQGMGEQAVLRALETPKF